MRLFLITLALIFANQATAITLSEMESVRVIFEDGAKNGCWTNLRESREYVEEKLRQKGAKITDRDTLINARLKTYMFYLNVNAKRIYKDGTGPCYGNVKAKVETITTVNGDDGFFILKDEGSIILRTDNFNRDILDIISDLVRELD